MTPTAPIICMPLGTLPLDKIDAFPPAAARDLERDHEIRTLFDLQPHVEKLGGDVDAVRKTFISLGVRKEHLDQCTWSLLRHLNPGGVPEPEPKKRKRVTMARIGPAIVRVIHEESNAAPIVASSGEPNPSAARFACQDCLAVEQPTIVDGVTAVDHLPNCTLTHRCPVCARGPGDKCIIRRKLSDKPHKERAALCTTPHHSAPPDDFDENTPPPRTRPSSSDPVPRYVKLHAGDSPVAKFFEWHKAGRIPAGSVLCKCVWTDFGARSGYQVEASVWPPPLGEPGDEITIEAMKDWYCRVSIMLIGTGNFAVMSRL